MVLKNSMEIAKGRGGWELPQNIRDNIFIREDNVTELVAITGFFITATEMVQYRDLLGNVQ